MIEEIREEQRRGGGEGGRRGKREVGREGGREEILVELAGMANHTSCVASHKGRWTIYR